MATASPKTVLIAGAGIGGPAVALLLTNAGHKCTIVERAPDFRSSGQQIDVAGEALKVLKAMGVEAACRERRVADDGIKFVDANDGVLAAFGASSEAGALVKDLEIMRPDLAAVLYEATKSKVEYIFNEIIKTLTQNDHGATATFASSTPERTFDLVVAADGLRSSTRALAFPADNTQLVTFNQFAAYFSIPWAPSDGTWSRWFNVPGGRTLSTRPHVAKKTTGAYLCQITPDAGEVATMSQAELRKELAKRFQDAGWEGPRILEYLQAKEGEGLYCQEVAQAKSSRLVAGRVALLGDAGYCPAPISGQGSSIALIGAYILAGCVAGHEDVAAALREYERLVRPFADGAQKLPPGVPWIVNPQSALGIGVLNSAFRAAGFLVNSGVAGTISKVVAPVMGLFGGKEPTLPEFPGVHVESEG